VGVPHKDAVISRLGKELSVPLGSEGDAHSRIDSGLRICLKIILSIGEIARLDFVVPITVEFVAPDFDLRHFLIGDLNTGLVGFLV
jgi:hypothetical protein